MTKLGARNLQEVELLTPLDKTKPFFKVLLYIDPATHAMVSIKWFDKGGNRYTLDTTRLNGNAPLTDGQFAFNKAKYPGGGSGGLEELASSFTSGKLSLSSPQRKAADIEPGEIQHPVDHGCGDLLEGFWPAIKRGCGGANDAPGQGQGFHITDMDKIIKRGVPHHADQFSFFPSI